MAERSGFAVQFLSRFTGYACFADWLSKDGVAGLRSTTSPVEIAFWPSREEAVAWLARLGLAEHDPVPIGVGHMTVSVRPFDCETAKAGASWVRGSLFELSARAVRERDRAFLESSRSIPPAIPPGPAPEAHRIRSPSPARKRKGRAAAGQAAFNFGE